MKNSILFSLLVCFALVGCSDSGDTPTASNNDNGGGGGDTDTIMSFATDVRPLIQNNSCLNSGCHGEGLSQGGFSFGSATYSDVRNASGTNGPLIVVGDASNSNIYKRLVATSGRMPQGFPALSLAETNKIKDWINQGALNN